MVKLTYRTSVAGLEVIVRDQKDLDARFKMHGGRVLTVSDKSIEMEFPTFYDAAAFRTAARRLGAIID